MLVLDLDLLFIGLAIVALVIFVRRTQRRRNLQEGTLERTRRLLEENREIDEMLDEMHKHDSPFKKD